jgi:deoxyribonuclease V
LVLDRLTWLGLLVVDGYADLGPGGRPGPGTHAHADFGVPVIGVAKSRLRTATHVVPVLHRSSARPLFLSAAGMPAVDAAELVQHVTGRRRLPMHCAAPRLYSRAGRAARTKHDRPPARLAYVHVRSGEL